MLAVSIPNLATSAAFVETATKCLATDFSSPPEAFQRPIASGVSVGHRLQRGESFGRDDEKGLRGIEILDGFGKVGAIHVGNETERHDPVAVMLERLVGHDRTKVGPADADVNDVADASFLYVLSTPRCGRDLKIAPSCRARCGPGALHSLRQQRWTAPLGARRATCSTARFSVVLIFSPRNMASMRARRPDSSASSRRSLTVSSVTRFFE